MREIMHTTSLTFLIKDEWQPACWQFAKIYSNLHWNIATTNSNLPDKLSLNQLEVLDHSPAHGCDVFFRLYKSKLEVMG